MKTLVDCDHVFDVLTRGPFPNSTEPTEPIEQHLAVCHECRQLAEALRPGVEIMHEALSVEERKLLPAFLDDSLMERLQQKITDAVFDFDIERVERIDRACRRWLSPAFVFIPMSMAVLLMVMGMPLISSRIDRRSDGPGSDIASAGMGALREDSGHYLASIDPPENCLRNVSWQNCFDGDVLNATGLECKKCHDVPTNLVHLASLLPSDASTNVHCCTSCHMAANDSQHSQNLSHEHLSSILNSCRSCHM